MGDFSFRTGIFNYGPRWGRFGHLVEFDYDSQTGPNHEIVDIGGFGIPEQVPIEFSQDIAPEDDLLENSDLDVFSSQVSDHANHSNLIPISRI